MEFRNLGTTNFRTRHIQYDPNSTIEMEPAAEETLVHYAMHPDVPRLFQPLVAIFAPAYGRWDLDRYFRQLSAELAAH